MEDGSEREDSQVRWRLSVDCLESTQESENSVGLHDVTIIALHFTTEGRDFVKTDIRNRKYYIVVCYLAVEHKLISFSR
jgi:hypothetical protein